MRVDHIRRARAIQVARQGISRAREQAERAAARLSRLESQRIKQAAGQQQRKAEHLRQARKDYIRDYVELSRARAAARANAKVIRSSTAASREVNNLGRRVDVRG